MNEIEMKDQIRAAVSPPPAPKELTGRTAQRAIAIEQGRQAEEQLRQMGAAPPCDESMKYAAQAVIGRMAHHILPPVGVTADAMVAQLCTKEPFKRAVNKPADAILSALQSGALMRTLAGRKPAQPKVEEPSLQKQEDGPQMGR